MEVNTPTRDRKEISMSQRQQLNGSATRSLYHERIGIYLLSERVVADDSGLLSLSHCGSVGRSKT